MGTDLSFVRSFRIAIAAAMLLAVIGCGSGSGSGSGDGGEGGEDDGSTPSTVADVGGRVIDGYIAGATVFLDLNFNERFDEGEPSAVSEDTGSYRLELSESQRRCLGYAPIVVDVPVGAVDQEQGEVSEAYRMVLPPPFEPVSDEQYFDISPLTSVVWSAIEAELEQDVAGLSCDSVLAQEAERERLRGILEGAIEDVVSHYNISEAQLFADFIANGDSEAKATALAIVKGLKKSFAETLALREQHPEAQFVRANYHQFDSRDAGDQYPDAWYRETLVFDEGHSTFHLQKVTEDLDNVVRTIIYGERKSISRDGFDFYESVEWESRRGDDSGYSCDVKEGVSTASDGRRYELTNLINKSADTFEGCTGSDFTAEAYMRYANIGYSDDTTDFSTQFMFRRSNSGFPDLNAWLDLEPQLDTLDINEVINSFEGLPYGFNETGMGGADSWHKRKRYMDGQNRVMLYKSSNGTYRRTTTFPDGTHVTECSTDGVVWGACD